MDPRERMVEIILDKPRKLKLDLNAMANFEKATGKNFSSAMPQPLSSDLDKVEEVLGREFSPKTDMVRFEEITGKTFPMPMAGDIRALLWACLIHEDSKLTQSDVGKMVDMSNLEEISGKIAELAEISMPKPKEKKGRQRGKSLETPLA